jgi:hypothetical protein
MERAADCVAWPDDAGQYAVVSYMTWDRHWFDEEHMECRDDHYRADIYLRPAEAPSSIATIHVAMTEHHETREGGDLGSPVDNPGHRHVLVRT